MGQTLSPLSPSLSLSQNTSRLLNPRRGSPPLCRQVGWAHHLGFWGLPRPTYVTFRTSPLPGWEAPLLLIFSKSVLSRGNDLTYLLCFSLFYMFPSFLLIANPILKLIDPQEWFIWVKRYHFFSLSGLEPECGVLHISSFQNFFFININYYLLLLLCCLIVYISRVKSHRRLYYHRMMSLVESLFLDS